MPAPRKVGGPKQAIPGSNHPLDSQRRFPPSGGQSARQNHSAIPRNKRQRSFTATHRHATSLTGAFTARDHTAIGFFGAGALPKRGGSPTSGSKLNPNRPLAHPEQAR
jgi:hypothetical protein